MARKKSSTKAAKPAATTAATTPVKAEASAVKMEVRSSKRASKKRVASRTDGEAFDIRFGAGEIVAVHGGPDDFWVASVMDDVLVGDELDSLVAVQWYEQVGTTSDGNQDSAEWELSDVIDQVPIDSLICALTGKVLFNVDSGGLSIPAQARSLVAEKLEQQLDDNYDPDQEAHVDASGFTKRMKLANRLSKKSGARRRIDDDDDDDDEPATKKGTSRKKKATANKKSKGPTARVKKSTMLAPRPDVALVPDWKLACTGKVSTFGGDSERAAKEAHRAVLAKDTRAMGVLLSEDQKDVESLVLPLAADVPLRPAHLALMQGDVKLAVRLVGESALKVNGSKNVVTLQSLDSGTHTSSQRSYNRRQVAATRGGKEGNNAFLSPQSEHIGGFVGQVQVLLFFGATCLGGGAALYNEIVREAAKLLRPPTYSGPDEPTMAELRQVVAPGNWKLANLQPGLGYLGEDAKCMYSGHRFSISELVRAGDHKLSHQLLSEVLDHGWGLNKYHVRVLSQDPDAFEAEDNVRAASAIKMTSADMGLRICPQHCAATNPDTRHLEQLINANSQATTMLDSHGGSVLHYASVCCSPAPLVLLLTQHPSAVNVPFALQKKGTGFGETPLHWAVRAGRPENIRVLLGHEATLTEHGLAGLAAAESLAQQSQAALSSTRGGMAKGFTPIHSAVASFHPSALDTLRALLECKADANAPTAGDVPGLTKLTPAHVACMLGHLDRLELLVAHGANIGAVDKLQRTTLILAAKNGHVHVVSYLVRAGLDPNASDASGNTALQYAAAFGWSECVKFLLDVAGADVNARNDWNLTATALALHMSRPECAGLLLNSPDVDVNICDNTGTSLLQQVVAAHLAREGARFEHEFQQWEATHHHEAADYDLTPPTPQAAVDALPWAAKTILANPTLKLDSRNTKGESILHLIARADRPYAVYNKAQHVALALYEHFVSLGADPAGADADGCTPLSAAVSHQHPNRVLVHHLLTTATTATLDSLNPKALPAGRNVLHMLAMHLQDDHWITNSEMGGDSGGGGVGGVGGMEGDKLESDAERRAGVIGLQRLLCDLSERHTQWFASASCEFDHAGETPLLTMVRVFVSAGEFKRPQCVEHVVKWMVNLSPAAVLVMGRCAPFPLRTGAELRERCMKQRVSIRDIGKRQGDSSDNDSADGNDDDDCDGSPSKDLPNVVIGAEGGNDGATRLPTAAELANVGKTVLHLICEAANFGRMPCFGRFVIDTIGADAAKAIIAPVRGGTAATVMSPLALLVRKADWTCASKTVPGKGDDEDAIPSATADALSMLQLLLDAGGDLGAVEVEPATQDVKRRVALAEERGDTIAPTLSHALDGLLRDATVTDDMLLQRAIQEIDMRAPCYEAQVWSTTCEFAKSAPEGGDHHSRRRHFGYYGRNRNNELVHNFDVKLPEALKEALAYAGKLSPALAVTATIVSATDLNECDGDNGNGLVVSAELQVGTAGAAAAASSSSFKVKVCRNQHSYEELHGNFKVRVAINMKSVEHLTDAQRVELVQRVKEKHAQVSAIHWMLCNKAPEMPTLRAVVQAAPKRVCDVDAGGASVLRHAVNTKRDDWLAFFLEHAPHALGSASAVRTWLNTRDSHRGQTALLAAVRQKNVVMARRLLSAGADPCIASESAADKSDEEAGASALHMAVALGLCDLVSEFLDAAAANGNENAVNAVDARGLTPLLVASRDPRRTDELLVLLKRGADVTARDDKARTPLINAVIAKARATEPVLVDHDGLLLEHGADVNAVDAAGRSAIHYALRIADLELWNFPHSLPQAGGAGDGSFDPIEDVSKLCGVPGAQVDIRDEYGRSPLHYAVAGKATVCALHLLHRKADVEAAERDGNTPLTLAVLCKHQDLAIILANQGASVTQDVVDTKRKKRLSSSGEVGGDHEHADEEEEEEGEQAEAEAEEQPQDDNMEVDDQDQDDDEPKRSIVVTSRSVHSLVWHTIRNQWHGFAFFLIDLGFDRDVAIADSMSLSSYDMVNKLITRIGTDAAAVRDATTGFTLIHRLADIPSFPSDKWAVEICRRLVHFGVPAAAQDVEKRTVVHIAASRGHLALLKLAMGEYGLSAAAGDVNGNSPVVHALVGKCAGNTAVLTETVAGLLGKMTEQEAQAVLAHRFTVKRKSKLKSELVTDVSSVREWLKEPEPELATVEAVAKHEREVKERAKQAMLAKKKKKKMSDADERDKEEESVVSTAIIESVRLKAYKLVDMLCKIGDLGEKDEWGLTALHHAVLAGDARMAVQLLSRGARVPEGLMFHVLKEKDWKMASLLSRFGGDMTEVVAGGVSALHIAILANDPVVTDRVLRAGAWRHASAEERDQEPGAAPLTSSSSTSSRRGRKVSKSKSKSKGSSSSSSSSSKAASGDGDGDANTFAPFDRVLVRFAGESCWCRAVVAATESPTSARDTVSVVRYSPAFTTSDSAESIKKHLAQHVQQQLNGEPVLSVPTRYVRTYVAAITCAEIVKACNPGPAATTTTTQVARYAGFESALLTSAGLITQEQLDAHDLAQAWQDLTSKLVTGGVVAELLLDVGSPLLSPEHERLLADVRSTTPTAERVPVLVVRHNGNGTYDVEPVGLGCGVLRGVGRAALRPLSTPAAWCKRVKVGAGVLERPCEALNSTSLLQFAVAPFKWGSMKDATAVVDVLLEAGADASRVSLADIPANNTALKERLRIAGQGTASGGSPNKRSRPSPSEENASEEDLEASAFETLSEAQVNKDFSTQRHLYERLCAEKVRFMAPKVNRVVDATNRAVEPVVDGDELLDPKGLKALAAKEQTAATKGDEKGDDDDGDTTAMDESSPPSGDDDAAKPRKKKDYYDVVMTKVDVMRNRGKCPVNNFYKMQILHDAVQQVFVLVTNWGMVGEHGKFQQTPFVERTDAIKEFSRVFRSKTGNWWAERHCFNQRPGKYLLLDTVHPRLHKSFEQLPDLLVADANSGAGAKAAVAKSKLPKAVQEMVGAFVSKPMLETAAASSTLNVHRMPLGRMSFETLESATNVVTSLVHALNEVQRISNDPSASVKEYTTALQVVAKLTNQFYEKVPVNGDNVAVEAFESVTDNNFVRQVERLRVAKEMHAAVRLMLASRQHMRTIHPLDYCHRAMGASMSVVDPSSLEHRIIQQYFATTRGDDDSTAIASILRVKRPEDEKRFVEAGWDRAKEANRKLLWHGSATYNMVGLMSHGLKVAPPEAPVSGYAFGKGIYFADMAAKSYHYTTTTPDENGRVRSFMLLCEVALGREFEAQDFMSERTSAMPGTESTVARGECGPLPQRDMVIDAVGGVTVPMGPVTDVDHNTSAKSGCTLSGDAARAQWRGAQLPSGDAAAKVLADVSALYDDPDAKFPAEFVLPSASPTTEVEDPAEAAAAAKATGQADKYVLEARYGPLSQMAVLKTRHAANGRVAAVSHAVAPGDSDDDDDSCGSESSDDEDDEDEDGSGSDNSDDDDGGGARTRTRPAGAVAIAPTVANCTQGGDGTDNKYVVSEQVLSRKVTKRNGLGVGHTEYIVYNAHQVRIKYVVELASTQWVRDNVKL